MRDLIYASDELARLTAENSALRRRRIADPPKNSMSGVTLDAVRRVLALAERQLDQDRRSLSGPSITLEMQEDVRTDQRAIDWLKNAFRSETPKDSN